MRRLLGTAIMWSLMERDRTVEESIRDFYETQGWTTDESGRTLDARLFEDPRPAARRYAASQVPGLDYWPAA